MTRTFYRLLLLAYPEPIRAEFGREMEVAFGALCAEQKGSVGGLLSVCWREAVDAVRAGSRQRGARRPQLPSRPLGSMGPSGGALGPSGGASSGGPHRGAVFAGMTQDLRYAARALRLCPGFTAVAVLTLALGIGANTAMFSLIDATLLRPLVGVEHSGRLAVVYEYTRGRHGAASYPDYRDLRASAAFESLAATTLQSATLQTTDTSERISAQLVSANYFDVLGARPTLGRGFRAEEEDGFGAHPVAVLSHGLWTRRFASNPQVLGRTIVLNGTSFEVVGVAAERFRGAGLQSSPDVWVPMVMVGTLTDLPFGDDLLEFRGLMMFSMVGRLAEGVTLAAAQAALDLSAAAIEESAPGMFDQPRAFLAMPAVIGAFRPTARGDVARYTGVLFAVSSGLLLIACMNIAGLLAVRATARRREVAVRLALGAGRVRLIRQLVTEGLLLATLGAVGAALVAYGSLPLLQRLQLPAGVAPDLILDARLLAFGALVATVTGLVFGCVPAFGAFERPAAALHGARRLLRGRRLDGRALLVVTQVSLTVLLLIGAGLLVRSVINLRAVDTGFNADDVLLASFDLEQAGYGEDEGRLFLREVATRLRDLDGVVSVGVGSDVPLAGAAGAQPLYIEGAESLEAGTVGQSLVGPDYFTTLGVPLLAGREFDRTDRPDVGGVVIVNESMAGLAWPGRDPLGQRVRLGQDGPESTVIGVVRDYRHGSLRRQPGPRLYWAIEQQYAFLKGRGGRQILARVNASPLAMLGAVRTVVRNIDPAVPLYAVTTLSDHVSSTMAEERQSAALLGVFAMLALVLSAVGLFGVLAYTVAQQRREIGIRCALGAQGADVAAQIVRRGLAMACTGIVLGLVAAAVASRVLAAWLFEVQPVDGATFAVISILVLAVAALASFLPARRATLVDPVIALRSE